MITTLEAPRRNPHWTGLRCFKCDKAHAIDAVQTVCTDCGMPLRVDYDYAAIARTFRPGSLGERSRPASLWRYREVLPLEAGETSLLEGFTPLVDIGDRTFVKDESRNPTGSFKARGLCAAISVARLFGVRALSAPSAGNAAGALAAYAARAGMRAVVAMPRDTPKPFFDECALYGAEVHPVEGTIADAGKFLREHGPKDTFDVSTLREPHRIEGKKTMAYELFEQFTQTEQTKGTIPDVILYPTGGGTGLIGMWKAFDEMEAMGWIGKARPRLVSVQAEGCAPVVKGWDEKADVTVPWPNATTKAYGLRVPSPLGGFLCLRALHATNGTAIAVPERDIEPATKELASKTGLDICPEGGAAWAAKIALQKQGWIKPGESVVVFNTSTGLKYR